MDRSEIEKVAYELLTVLETHLELPGDVAERLRIESPILVRDLDANPAYWLVPAALGDRLVGFLRLSLVGDLIAYGRFGQGRQLYDFPLLSQLSEETADKEIHRAFCDDYKNISRPQIVHDGPLNRIAWLSRGRSADGKRFLLFWIFGTSYSRPADEKREHGSHRVSG